MEFDIKKCYIYIVVDIVSKTKLGQKASELVDKAIDFYDSFKKKFNIK